jgi:hypothetical protein
MRQRAKEGPWKQEQINILEYEASLQELSYVSVPWHQTVVKLQ